MELNMQNETHLTNIHLIPTDSYGKLKTKVGSYGLDILYTLPFMLDLFPCSTSPVPGTKLSEFGMPGKNQREG